MKGYRGWVVYGVKKFMKKKRICRKVGEMVYYCGRRGFMSFEGKGGECCSCSGDFMT